MASVTKSEHSNNKVADTKAFCPSQATIKATLEIIETDAFMQLLVENGFCSVPGRSPRTIYDKPVKKKTPELKLPANHPVSKYKRDEITEAALCNELGIKRNELLRYLVEHGVLFSSPDLLLILYWAPSLVNTFG